MSRKKEQKIKKGRFFKFICRCINPPLPPILEVKRLQGAVIFNISADGGTICMGVVSKIALVLVIIGALNWGLVGIFSFDLVAYLFGGMASLVSRIIYTVVGIAGIWCIALLFKDSRALDVTE